MSAHSQVNNNTSSTNNNNNNLARSSTNLQQTSSSSSHNVPGLQDPIFNSRIGSRLANSNAPISQQQQPQINSRRSNNVPPSRLNLSTEHIYSSSNNHQDRLNSSFNHHPSSSTQNISSNNNNINPKQQQPPSMKSGWRQQHSAADLESVLPSDSLYSAADDGKRRTNGSGGGGMAHWSSHGYLPKTESEVQKNSNFKKGQQQQPQPLSLPPHVNNQFHGKVEDGGERKYFSVRGFSDMRSKHSGEEERIDSSKYYSVDARYHADKALPQDVRAKLKENIRPQQQTLQYPPYPAPPPPPPKPNNIEKSGNLQSSKGLGGSVSWLEWTQQLQAYVAWVNSQLRKRPDLKPVQDLRCDLQSGEVLAQLIDIISGEKIAGIQYNPESLQGMRENLDRILQFMHSKRIRMHQITSKEILEGNLKAVMRLILALAAHYKPQSVRHHEQNGGVGNHRKEEEQKHVAKSTVQNYKGSMQNSSVPLSTGTDSPLNHTQESVSDGLSNNNNQPGSGIKRTPSLNESHYSHSSKDRLGPDPEPSQIYENLSSSTETEKLIVEEAMASATTQTEAESPLRPNMKREGSFVRTGSGRKLPKIPSNEVSPSKKQPLGDPLKSKPKALEFWESIEETMDRSDFRYNTIHRMSMGRRILPKPPSVRCHSLDRSMSGADIRHYEEDKLYSLDSNGYSDKKSEDFVSPPTPRKKIPADGCSLQSGGSSGDGIVQEESTSSASSRGEVEGSSDHHASPPTSVIGNGEPSQPWSSSYRQSNKWSAPSPVSQEYLKELSSDKYNPKYPCRVGDGRQSECSSLDGSSSGHQIPYDVLLQDLTQAKRQLMELHSLDNGSYDGGFSKHSSSRLNESSDIKQLKQNLVRTTLVKQNLEFEKSDLIRKIEDLEKEVNGIRSDVNDREKTIQKLQLQQNNGFSAKMMLSDHQLKTFYDEELNFAKDAIANLRTSFNEADPNQHILDTLEQCISVIIEKIQNLDSGNGGAIVSDKAPPLLPSSNRVNQSNRLNSILKPAIDGNALKTISTNHTNNNINNNVPTNNSNITHPPSTKILYFTNKSVTPFMSTVSKRIGEIVLRDFKNIFDRPGFYRYHFKTMDQEFGMVKEEISDDETILPGTEGKIVVWVEED
ncbi:dixin isoform X2 [Lepeophtheirus salmonis]